MNLVMQEVVSGHRFRVQRFRVAFLSTLRVNSRANSHASISSNRSILLLSQVRDYEFPLEFRFMLRTGNL